MSSTVVVKQVVAEMRAKTDELDRALAEMEGKAKRTKTQVEGVGGAMGGAGQQYAGAARNIAGATESIAASGNVSGAAAKQILTAGSNIAFAFGPAGAVVGALSIFALAATTAFRRAREEAEEAQRAFDATLEKFRLARDYRGVSGTVVTLLQGDPEAEGEAERLGLLRLRERVAQERAAILASRPDPSVRQTAQQRAARNDRIDALRKLEGALASLETRYQQAEATFTTIAQQEQERLGNEKRTAEEEKALLESRAAVRKAFDDAVRASATAIAQFDREAADFGRNFEATVLRELGSEVDRVRAAFDRLIEQGTRVAGANDPRVVQLKQLRDAAIAAASAEEALAAKRARQGKLDRLRRKLPEEDKRATADLAREIQQAVDGALQLAAAFGAVDASVVSVLRSLAQVAGNIPALQTALKAGSGLGIVSASLPILGALSSLIGRDPAEQQRREELRRNTDALKALTAKAGLLGIGVTGGDARAAQTMLRDFLSRSAGGFINAGGRTYDAADQATIAAERLGILDDLQRIAAQYGITLNRNISSFEQLAAALADTITKLGEFGTDLDSALQQADAEIQLRRITDPLEQLAIRLGALGGRSSAFDRLTAGLDLNSAEGRAAARDNALALFEILKAGGATLDADALGGLSGEELLRAILDLVASLDEADDALGVSRGTQLDAYQVSSDTQITADQASRLLGLSSSQLTVQREIRDLLAAAQGMATTPLPLPSSAVFAPPAAGGGTVTITIEQNFHGPVADPAALGTEQLAALTEHIRRALGLDVAIRRQYAGRIVS